MSRLDKIIGHVLCTISVLCLVGLFLLLFVNVVARTFQLAGFSWFDEIVQGLFAWMVFIGAAALWRERLHFRVDWLELSLGPGRARSVLHLAVSVLSLSFLIAMTIYGWDLTYRSRALTPILKLPTALFYVSMPIAGAVMTAYSLRDLLRTLHELVISRPSKEI